MIHWLHTNRSLAISYIEANTQGLKVAIAYLYCDYKDPKTQSELELLSSITRQLAEQSNPMPPEIKAFCEKYTEKRSYPSDDERISLVRAMSVLFERIYVFLDALVMLYHPVYGTNNLWLLIAIFYHLG